jgi:hypothetical protein
LLVVNKVLPELDFNALRQKVEETYQKTVAGILPLSNDMLRLAKRGRELPLKLKQALDKKKVE